MAKKLNKRFKLAKNVKKKRPHKDTEEFDNKSVHSQSSKETTHNKPDLLKNFEFEETRSQSKGKEVRMSLYQVKLGEKLKQKESYSKMKALAVK